MIDVLKSFSHANVFLAIVQMYYCKLRFSCKFITSRNIHEYQLRYSPSEKHFHRWKLFLTFAKKLKKRYDEWSDISEYPPKRKMLKEMKYYFGLTY